MNGAFFRKIGSSIVECLLVMITKKKSGNDKASWKYQVSKIWFLIDKFKISEGVRQREIDRKYGRVLIIVRLGWRIHKGHSIR